MLSRRSSRRGRICSPGGCWRAHLHLCLLRSGAQSRGAAGDGLRRESATRIHRISPRSVNTGTSGRKGCFTEGSGVCGAFLRCSYWYPGFILSISPSSRVKERNDYTEKELSQLFFKRRNFTFVSLPNCASSLLPLPGVPHWTRLPGSASGPSGAVCGVPGAERGNRVTGNRECSRRDCSVSRVAKLFDLLTHFIGIRKTT